jgi:hypothetical protein
MWDKFISEVQDVDDRLGGKGKELLMVRNAIAANVQFIQAEIEEERQRIVEVEAEKKKVRAALAETRNPDSWDAFAEEYCRSHYNSLLKEAKMLSNKRQQRDKKYLPSLITLLKNLNEHISKR